MTLHDYFRRNTPFVPALSNDLFVRMRSIRPHSRHDENNPGNPLRFTIHFDKHGQVWTARVEPHDGYWPISTDRLVKQYRFHAGFAMNGFQMACDGRSGESLRDSLASAFIGSLCARKGGRAGLREPYQ
jgi:hypothetical protein